MQLAFRSTSTVVVDSRSSHFSRITNKSFAEWKTPILTALLSMAIIASSPAHALDSSVYANEYSDPFHPLCQRKITVSGNTFHYSGTAVGPKNDPVRRGCSPKEIKEFGIRQGAFDGVIMENGKISAGDGIHEGIWEPAGTAVTTLGYEELDGIRWNDGNKWVVIPLGAGESAGKGFFLVYIMFSLAAGAKELVKRIRDNKTAE